MSHLLKSVLYEWARTPELMWHDLARAISAKLIGSNLITSYLFCPPPLRLPQLPIRVWSDIQKPWGLTSSPQPNYITSPLRWHTACNYISVLYVLYICVCACEHVRVLVWHKGLAVALLVWQDNSSWPVVNEHTSQDWAGMLPQDTSTETSVFCHSLKLLCLLSTKTC